MGKGTDILKSKAEAETNRVNATLDGFGPEDLADLAAEAIKTLPPASAAFFAKSDPTKSRVLRGLMVTYLAQRAQAARRAS